jgi:predicted metal-dependent hydrolase
MAITARDLKFQLTDAIASHWSPALPEFSHVANAFMAALPHLEPYFIHNLREAAEQITDPELRADIEGFIHQEARHAQQHRAWNQVLATRYPGFDALEQATKTRLSESKRTHSLAFRLAYTAAYEALTYQIVCFLMAERERWLRGADPRLVGMLGWHAAEEVEHKSVAYDAFQAVHGGYALRVWGLVQAFACSLSDIRAMTHLLLRVDGVHGDPDSRKRLRKVRLALAKRLLPSIRHYLAPGYHPSQHADPEVMLAWLAQYRAGADLLELDVPALDALLEPNLAAEE